MAKSTRRWAVGKPSVLIPNLLYLAVVMDLFSRMIVGWAATPTIHRELVLNAVLMAVRRRRPRGTLIHSDQGTQFASDAFAARIVSSRA